jgi:hypothetical protein
MLETNEEYMSQEKLDSILSGTHDDYVPSQKELDTNFTAKAEEEDD